jgi:hypothetical protein
VWLAPPGIVAMGFLAICALVVVLLPLGRSTPPMNQTLQLWEDILLLLAMNYGPMRGSGRRSSTLHRLFTSRPYS